MEDYDLLVVGGGINGVGIARDAAGRGLSVLLVEKDDLAAHTSSASSKLIHGGLRYLEQFEFKLVRESLAERERLLRSAPHIVQPLQFLIPIGDGGRPLWLLRAGLFLYDHLSRRTILPASSVTPVNEDGLRPGIERAVSYWDCKVQDSRLVVLNALDAAERGATILTHTELVEAHREEELWVARLRRPQREWSVRARALVNAAGPWAGELFGRIAGAKPNRTIRLVKGSHIVVPRLYDGEHAFLLQNPDGRVVFAIPFEGFTLVGTTDVDWTGAPDSPAIDDREIDYLLATLRRYFAQEPSRSDIVWSYSGIRSLVDDGAADASKVTRDYALELDSAGAPLLSVFGGKITTYRALAEKAVTRLAPFFPKMLPAWSAQAVLPGGDIRSGDVRRYASDLARRYRALSVELLGRLAGTYGTRSERILAGVVSVGDLGKHFGAGLYAKEMDYLVQAEWARTAEDVLFRRTKLGLHVGEDTKRRLADYLESLGA